MDEPTVPAADEPLAARAGLVAQPSAVRPLAAGLARRTVQASEASVWWVGAHGGAGETVLERLVPGSRAADHSWPIMVAADQGPARVCLLARTHAAGLLAAQRALAEWASGEVAVELLGVIFVADAPGRLPKPLHELRALVGGGAPRMWQLPWVPAWRLGEPVDPDTAPRAIARPLAELAELAELAQRPEPVTAVRPVASVPAQARRAS